MKACLLVGMAGRDCDATEDHRSYQSSYQKIGSNTTSDRESTSNN